MMMPTRRDEDVWLSLPKSERLWRAQAWGAWRLYIKPARLAFLEDLDEAKSTNMAYRLLEAEDLLPPWTPELMGDTFALGALVMPSHLMTGEQRKKQRLLRKKFIDAGIHTMEGFFK